MTRNFRSTSVLMAHSFTHPELDPLAVTTALAGAGFELHPPVRFSRTLLDTFDGRLRGGGLRLEMVESEGLELVLAGDGGPVAAPAQAAPRFARDLPPGPVRSRCERPIGVRALLPVITVSGTRTLGVQREATGQEGVVVALHDRLSVVGHGPLAPGWVIEVGEVAEQAAQTELATALLLSLGLEPHDADLFELMAAAAEVDIAGFHGTPTVPLDPREPSLDAFCRVLDNLAGAVEANWQGTLDDLDPEFLHDLRVAVRRTRSVLAQGKKVLPGQVRDRYRDGFGWLGTATSPARDLDVYVMEWERYVAPLGPEAATALDPVLEHIRSRRATEHEALGRVLRSDRYRDLLSSWRAWLRDPGAGRPKQARRPIGKVAADRTRRAQQRLVERGRAIAPSSPGEELHELRKDAKKLRYLLECFGTLFAPAPRKSFVQRLKALQDNLGEHQDAEVHVAQLQQIARQLQAAPGIGADTLAAIDQLTQHLEIRRQEARADFAHRFADYDTKKTSRTFEEALEPAAGG
ncbi:MAG: CHAD domain-containing protein [Actinobacteria bacterium]|nr:CHAD domain-containing protein [Actinomycetota bacterium]